MEKTSELIQSDKSLLIPKEKGIMVGNIFIEKNDLNFYNMYQNDKILFKDISFFDAAIRIAKYINKNKPEHVEKILEIDKEYAKHYMDMIFYLNTYKTAKNNNDSIKMSILEDKFYNSKMFAKLAKQKIKKI